MLEPIIFYSVIAAVSILAVCLGFISLLFKRNMDKFYALVDEEVHMRGIHLKANEYLQAASTQANQIIASATTFSNQEKANLQESIRKSSSTQAEQYASVLNELVRLLREDTAGQINNFHAQLLKQVSETENLMKSEADKQIQEYKKIWFEKIDSSMIEIVQNASKEILGKQISLSDHEDYVIKVLERSKSTHVF
ncbi:MAG: hypothetical protein US96_C0023G0007 [Candidatus Woesebacteria bacterium GW2011_GWB1_38_5b]|uniref:Uncharacterized protein n=1 Tax=Candidatus Woesebacteria bacterium GW2011_GWB1_38_5b TaxID=1618569 RepID=A0A0G0K568_9BACT|nr:MAG: hypothetical protein US96_C0023G0007 [Candidatus Woesebacteria bacterium GW2011_GWB1_38_5b]